MPRGNIHLADYEPEEAEAPAIRKASLTFPSTHENLVGIPYTLVDGFQDYIPGPDQVPVGRVPSRKTTWTPITFETGDYTQDTPPPLPAVPVLDVPLTPQPMDRWIIEESDGKVRCGICNITTRHRNNMQWHMRKHQQNPLPREEDVG